MFETINRFREAMQAGKRIYNWLRWKKGSLAVGDVEIVLSFALLVAVACGLNIDLSAQDVATIAGAVMLVSRLFHRTVAVATTTSLGEDYSTPGSAPAPRSIGRAVGGAPSAPDGDLHASDDGHYIPPVLRGEPPLPGQLSGADPKRSSPVDVAPSPLPRERQRDAGTTQFVDDGRNAGG